MKFNKGNSIVSARSILVIGAVLLMNLGLLSLSRLSSAQAQDGRPRRSDQTVPAKPTPTPTPIPVTTRPANQPQPTRVPTPTPTPTPTPVPVSTGKGPPKLGDAPPPPRLKPKPTPTPSDEIDPESTITVNTQLVTLNVRVIDRNNKPIDNVQKNDFHVYEDNVSQPIEYFTREEVPISYGLAVDTSLSLRNQFLSVIDAAKTIVNSNKKGDETFIERFISSDKINIEKEFTASKDELVDAIDNLFLEGGQTAVVDGVYLAAEHVAEYRKGDDSDRRRRALIVITDGEDRHSYYTEPQLLQRLREEDVQIYIIGFLNELDKESGFIKKSPREKAMSLLNKLATETGGRAFFPQSISEMPEIAAAIVRDMRTQYVLAYNPTNKERDGSYRAVRVTVDEGPQRDKRIALTRSGYVAPRQGAAPPKAPAIRTDTTRPAAGATKTP
jgi:Ca-activated chloride channel family protein